MQDNIQKFRQSSTVFEKPGILSEYLKTLTSSTYPIIQYFFCWNFAHVFYLPLSTKGCLGFILFYLDLELFAKIEKRSGFCTVAFYINNSSSKQNKKNPTHQRVQSASKK